MVSTEDGPPAGAAPPAVAPGRVAVSARTALARRLKGYAPPLALVALCLLIGALNPRFLEWGNVVRIANSAAVPLVLALGLTFIIVLGCIDLSVEGTTAAGAVAISLLVLNDHNAVALGSWWAAGLVLVVGAGIGALNGLLHVGLRIPSFMASLGVWFVGAGAATLVLGGATTRVLDRDVRGLALSRFGGLPLGVWVALGALVVTWVIQRYTRFGRYVYAVGGGEDLARLSGVPVGRVKVFAFTLAGTLYGLGGLLTAAQLGQGTATIANGRLFSAVTAVVVGGTALTGGEGGVLQTLVGVLITAVVLNGMVLLGVPPYLQPAVQGVLILVAVAVSIDRRRSRIVK